MQLLDDDNLGTMMEIWWSTGSENPQPVELFSELAGLEPIKKADAGERTNNGEDSDQDIEDFSDPVVDEVPDDIGDEGLEKIEDTHGPLFSNPSRGIVLQNEPRGDMLNVDLDVAHASKFPECADIVPAHRLASNW
ncbi:hypothetical protein GOBAR_AA25893 [Gossypium barbadense]|uniref:Uncharacterized protein n=1 Tax=Gossypium barbadense TaxID=3634 RepID=A0A2P5WUL4_GOSBA|nr:hypothetical protein GOBAR_AA25893 [Gossypium barbadense]